MWCNAEQVADRAQPEQLAYVTAKEHYHTAVVKVVREKTNNNSHVYDNSMVNRHDADPIHRESLSVINTHRPDAMRWDFPIESSNKKRGPNTANIKSRQRNNCCRGQKVVNSLRTRLVGQEKCATTHTTLLLLTY